MPLAARHPFLTPLALGLAHALFFGLAFPPVGLAPLAPLAVIALVLAGLNAPRPGLAGLAAGLGALPMWAFHHQYIWAMSEAGLFPLLAYLSLYPGLFVWLLVRSRCAAPRLPLALSVPALWVGLEFLRGEIVWHGYPWFLIAHPLIESPVALLAPIDGVYGVGVLLCAALGAALDLAQRPALRGRPAVAAMLVALVPFACLVRMPGGASEGSLRIAAVQTNIPQDNRMAWGFRERLESFADFAALTRRAASPGSGPPPALIVWPETMFPGLSLNASAVEAEREAGLAYEGAVPTTVFHDGLIALQQEVGAPMMVGAIAHEGLRFETDERGAVRDYSESRHNSAFIVSGGAVDERRYDKMHLTPFGEVMPYISAWPWLQQRLLAIGGRGMAFDLEPGREPRVLVAPVDEGTLRIAAPICFEVTMARVCRRLVAGPEGRRADLLVNLSNDGWFAWFDAGRENLVLQSRWRCLELGTPMVRAANTGLSVAIDHRGRMVSGGPGARVAGVLDASMDTSDRPLTIFARTGGVLGWVCLLGLSGIAVWTVSRGRAPAAGASRPRTPIPLKATDDAKEQP